MLEIVVIIGITMAITEAIKPHIPKSLLFVPVLVLAAGLNAANAHYLGAIPLEEAIAEGIKYGAMASGVYGLGKEALQGFLGNE